jgi:hypothetical protein
MKLRRYDLSNGFGDNTFVQTRIYSDGSAAAPNKRADRERADVLISVDEALSREELEILIAHAVHDLLSGSARLGGEAYDAASFAREALLKHSAREAPSSTYDNLVADRKAARP